MGAAIVLCGRDTTFTWLDVYFHLLCAGASYASIAEFLQVQELKKQIEYDKEQQWVPVSLITKDLLVPTIYNRETMNCCKGLTATRRGIALK